MAENTPNRVSNTNQTNKGIYLVEIKGTLNNKKPISVVAAIPEQIGIQIDNEWEAWAGGGTFPTFGNFQIPGVSKALGAYGSFARLRGQSTYSQAFSLQTWHGTSPLEIQLPLLFDARNDPYTDVVTPISDLIRLASPYRVGLEDVTKSVESAVEYFDDEELSEQLSQGVSRGENFIDNVGRALGVDNVPEIFRTILHAPGPTIFDAALGRQSTQIELHIGRLIHLHSVIINSISVNIPTRYTRNGYPIQADVDVSLRTHWTLSREDYERQLFLGNR